MKAVLWMVLVALATPLAAQVYRCEVEGEIIFSQLPCAEDAEAIELRVPRPAASADGQEESFGSGAVGVDEHFLERRRLERELAANQRSRERLVSERERALAAFREQVRATSSRLRAAEIELEAVRSEDRYNAQIREVETARRELEQRLQELNLSE